LIRSLTRVACSCAQDPREGVQTVLRGGITRLRGQIDSVEQDLSHPFRVPDSRRLSGLRVFIRGDRNLLVLSVELVEVNSVRIGCGSAGTHSDGCVLDWLNAGPRATPLAPRVFLTVSDMLYEDRFGSVISSSAEDIKHTDNDEERDFSELTVLQFSSDHLS